MNLDLRSARDAWAKEDPSYRALCNAIEVILRDEIARVGISATVTSRTKEITSILKKLVRDNKSYDEVTDKAGIRIVVRFLSEIQEIEKIIQACFVVLKRDDKTERLPFYELGYQAIHFDVRLKALQSSQSDRIPCELPAEIQLRTHCQDLWAIVAHELSYKSALEVPPDIQRRIYLLNAVLEVADREFLGIHTAIQALPGAGSLRLLQQLERHYYKYVGGEFDRVLSLEVIQQLIGLYDSEKIDEIEGLIAHFVHGNSDKIGFVYTQYLNVEDRPIFLFQPEVFMILDLFEDNQYELEATWSRRFPREELARLTLAWGQSLD